MHFQFKLHNNFVLTGSVDSYCLVCDNYLRSEDEAFTHTEKPIHKKNLGATTRVEKFLDDRIIKVKKGYYCPYCNILLSTTTKVTIHIANTNHKENKLSQMLSRVGDKIIAFDEVAITLESWHGLVDNTCVICNIEFDREDIHRTDQGHVLRLVQSKCEFGDKYLYRKVDEDSFFCLICQSVFLINEKQNHHESISHKNQYNSGKELKNKIPQDSKNIPKTTTKPNTNNTNNENTEKDETKKNDDRKTDKDTEILKPDIKSTSNIKDPKITGDGKTLSENKETIMLVKKAVHSDNISEKKEKKSQNVNGAAANGKSEMANKEVQSDILDRVDEFQKKGINIDFTWERARCKHCNEDLSFNSAAIEQHIKERHNIIKSDKIEPKFDLKKQAKKLDTIEVKTDTNKIDNNVEQKDSKKVEKTVDSKTEAKKMKRVVEPKPESKKQPKKSDNEVKLETKKTDNAVLPDTKKQHQKSENSNKVKTDTNKTDKNIEPNTNSREQLKKSDNKPKLEIKKELERFANENNLVVMPNEAYCPLCEVGISLNMAAMNEHANLNSHKNKKPDNNAMLGKRVQTSQCMELFIRVESNLGSDIILNNKYVLRQNSFHCIQVEDDMYMCMVCYASFPKACAELTQHINGPDHKTKLGLCKVVSSLPEEFIREITSVTPEMYHCGYCNELFHDWTEMQDHLSHSKHLYARRHAQWNLERCHSVIWNAWPMQVSSMHAINYA